MSPLRFWPPALLLISGCILAPGDCGYELRSLELAGGLTGSALRPGEPPAQASVVLAESRNGVSYRILSAYVTTQAAVAISRVELRRTNSAGTGTLTVFPPGNGQSGTWGANIDLPPDSLPFGMLSLLGHTRQLSLSVQVGVQGNLGDLAGPLRIRSETGWKHPRCD